MRWLILVLLFAPACTSDPGQVQVECLLPEALCAPWYPTIVTRDLQIHQNLWRETFPETDEWLPRAPILPTEITIVDTWNVCEVAPCSHQDSASGISQINGSMVLSGYYAQASDPELVATPVRSALAHELVHFALSGAYLDGDHNHSEPPGPWGTEHDRYIEELREAWEK